jgi:hypothetical protein
MFTDEQLASALSGMAYPARRREMATWAELNCAPGELCEALRHIPDGLYRDRCQVRDTFLAVQERARGI